MNKINLLVGFIIGIIATILGTFIFLQLFSEYDLGKSFHSIKRQEILNKVITLGTLLNVVLFFILLKLKQNIKAKGVIFATIFLTIVTLFL